MDTREQVLAILKEVKPTKDLEGINDLIEGGYIDSFELMSLVANLTDTFNIEITIDELIPENFNSVDAIVSMVEKLNG